MKQWLVALVVANVLLFGWFRGWMAPLGGDGREPARLARQVQPDELRVVPVARLAAGAAASAPGAAGPKPAPAETGGSAAAPPAPAKAPEPAPAAAAPPALPRTGGCVAIGVLTEADAVRAQAALDAVAPNLTITMIREDDITSWWVYLPPAPGDLARRVAELRSSGVKDIYVMPDGNWRGAISLGLFRQEELAVALARAITDRGVRGVRVAPRGPNPGRLQLQVQPVTEPVAAELERLRVQHPDAALRPCGRG